MTSLTWSYDITFSNSLGGYLIFLFSLRNWNKKNTYQNKISSNTTTIYRSRELWTSVKLWTMMRAGKWKWKCDTYFVIKLSQNGNGLAVCMYINGLFFCPHPLLHYYYILVHCEQKVFPKPANFKCILIHLIQNWPDPLLPIKMKGLKYDKGFFSGWQHQQSYQHMMVIRAWKNLIK